MHQNDNDKAPEYEESFQSNTSEDDQKDSGGGGSSSSHNNNKIIRRDHCLKHLNKLSHKMSKPFISKKQPFDQTPSINIHQQRHERQPQQQSQQQPTQQPHQPQPPVYNINKNDFRDVVQKLTGSPAHERISAAAPPIHQPKPPSSRLQRIRPPPLAHCSNHPPPLLNSTVPTQQPPVLLNTTLNPIPTVNSFIQRLPAPLSPLPPCPAVHDVAESPVSAYMRYLQNSMSTVDPSNQFSGFSPLAPLVSPRWNNLAHPQQQQQQQNSQQESAAPQQQGMIHPSQPPLQLAASPLPFGCLNSPRSPYPLLSPSLLFSPSSFSLSPTLPVPSPTWRGH